MNKKIVFLLSLMALTACTKQQTTGIHLENLDTTAVAQNDFYQYACGGWMKNNPLPNEYSRFGSFDKLGLSNLEHPAEIPRSRVRRASLSHVFHTDHNGNCR